MSSRDPMWYCHECHAEMRPLMVPQPTCASCHGTFVEMMENPADDPRQFSAPGLPGGFHGGPADMISALQSIMSHGLAEERLQRSNNSNASSSFSFQIRSSDGTNTYSTRTRSPSNDPPTLSEFLRRRPNGGADGSISGPLMTQYLMALLGQRGHPMMFPPGMDGDDMDRGRFGDYVFSQEALDQIISQIMENTNANKPVPAPEEKIQELPKEVLEEGSPTLEKDCAVCKDQFQLGTEDPAEQVVVTLPCKHPFHEPCIVPWLKSSGTCPVCRYALVPQPEHHAPGSPTSDPSGSNPRASPPRPGSNDTGLPMNIFQALFGNMNASGEGRSGSPSQRQRDTRSPNRRSTTDSDSNRHVPGEWHEDLD